MATNYVLAIKHYTGKYDSIDFMKDCILVNNGSSVFIASWDADAMGMAQPTLAELDTHWSTNTDFLAWLKDFKNEKVKKEGFKRLESTDWKALRHKDQVDNSETTSLTGAEYTALLNDRKAIRDASNNVETTVNGKTTPESVLSVDISAEFDSELS